ncbi:hypothetical protein COV18_03845 [Candidatus Woesearchaeota archaeon CG10_big_fil_rev_8_21_14_0_10_37_12]|nr:MAG: hypothetical protein COV18_03845 [Candidatus Woesearchaeota archaeon CG10_big_fil_rev_8_21_14_0_10_37_12]
MNAKILEDLGLTPGEVKVYLALLELGPSSAGDIIDKSHLQNSVVHFCLNKLRELGLVSYIKKGKNRVYQSANPENLLIMLEDKKKSLKQIMPELKTKQTLAKQKQSVELFEGVKGITNMLNQLIVDGRKGDEFLFFSTDVAEHNEEIQQYYERYDAKRSAKKLVVKGIARDYMKQFYVHRKTITMKYVDSPIPANVALFKDKIALMTWGEYPQGILIKSKQLAEKQKAFFNEVWKKN